MPFDSYFYEKAVKDFKKGFSDIFKDSISMEDEYCNFSQRGYFKLLFHYHPLDYSICIENEIKTFTIVIEDSENAQNALYRIEKFDNALTEDNIRKSIYLLKKVLEENEFDLYLYINKKTYRKNSKGVKRVKDIQEI